MPRRGTLWRGGMKITRAERHPHCHPDRSGGIFLAHRYSAVCETAEKGKPFAKGTRKSGVQGRFLAALEMTVWGNGFISRSVQRICWENATSVTSSRAKPSIFPAHWYSALCGIAEKGKPLAKGARKSRVQVRFLAALEMTVWGGMGLFHVVYNGYVCKALFPYRHPERSRGIFLAHWYSVLCETAEKGKPFAKGARKNKAQGRFLAALEMTVGGNGFISRSVQRICLESAIPVTSSRAKWRDLSCTSV